MCTDDDDVVEEGTQRSRRGKEVGTTIYIYICIVVSHLDLHSREGTVPWGRVCCGSMKEGFVFDIGITTHLGNYSTLFLALQKR